MARTKFSQGPVVIGIDNNHNNINNNLLKCFDTFTVLHQFLSVSYTAINTNVYWLNIES